MDCRNWPEIGRKRSVLGLKPGGGLRVRWCSGGGGSNRGFWGGKNGGGMGVKKGIFIGVRRRGGKGAEPWLKWVGCRHDVVPAKQTDSQLTYT